MGGILFHVDTFAHNKSGIAEVYGKRYENYAQQQTSSWPSADGAQQPALLRHEAARSSCIAPHNQVHTCSTIFSRESVTLQPLSERTLCSSVLRSVLMLDMSRLSSTSGLDSRAYSRSIWMPENCSTASNAHRQPLVNNKLQH
jgi:hypothetical protein